MKIYSVISLLAALFSWQCNSTKSTHTSMSVFEQSVAATALEQGIGNGSFTLSKQQKWTYTLAVPELKTATTYPLVIALHWASPSQQYSGEQLLRCLVEPVFRSTNAIIWAPAAGNLNWWEPMRLEQLTTFVEYAKRHWPIAPDRIVVTGYSNGGNGAWALARQRPDLLSAAIPLAAPEQSVQKMELPVFAIHGQEDELFPYVTSRENVTAIAARSTQVRFLTASGRRHFEACTYGPELAQAVEWLTAEVWLK